MYSDLPNIQFRRPISSPGYRNWEAGGKALEPCTPPPPPPHPPFFFKASFVFIVRIAQVCINYRIAATRNRIQVCRLYLYF